MEETGPRTNNILIFTNIIRQICFMVEIEDDNRYETEEQFSLRFVVLEGSSIRDNIVFDPSVSNITILDNEGILWW